MSVDRFIKKNKRKVNEKISLRQEVTVSTIVYTAWIFTFLLLLWQTSSESSSCSAKHPRQINEKCYKYIFLNKIGQKCRLVGWMGPLCSQKGITSSTFVFDSHKPHKSEI